MSYSKRDILGKILLNGKGIRTIYVFECPDYVLLPLEKYYSDIHSDYMKEFIININEESTMLDKFTIIDEGSIYVNNVYLKSRPIDGINVRGYNDDSFIIPPGSIFKRESRNEISVIEGDSTILSYVVQIEEILTKASHNTLREKIEPYIQGGFRLRVAEGDVDNDQSIFDINIFKDSKLLIDVDKLIDLFDQELQIVVEKLLKETGKLVIKNYSFTNININVTWTFKNYEGRRVRYTRSRRFEYNNLMDIDDVLDKIGGNQ